MERYSSGNLRSQVPLKIRVPIVNTANKRTPFRVVKVEGAK
jgi:hypothetical protein